MAGCKLPHSLLASVSFSHLCHVCVKSQKLPQPLPCPPMVLRNWDGMDIAPTLFPDPPHQLPTFYTGRQPKNTLGKKAPVTVLISGADCPCHPGAAPSPYPGQEGPQAWRVGFCSTVGVQPWSEGCTCCPTSHCGVLRGPHLTWVEGESVQWPCSESQQLPCSL